MGTRLFVGNLRYSTDESRLREVFENGNLKVASVRIITDRDTGQSRGFGFVELDPSEDLQAAIQQLDGFDVDGRKLSVREAFDSPRRGGPGGGPGGPPRGNGRPEGGGGGRRFDDRGPPRFENAGGPPRRFDDRGGGGAGRRFDGPPRGDGGGFGGPPPSPFLDDRERSGKLDGRRRRFDEGGKPKKKAKKRRGGKGWDDGGMDD